MLGADTLLVGRYRLVDRVARGGMGSVWRAWDERLQRTVAVKQLDAQPGQRGDDGADARDRALREARIAARLHHANAVAVYDVVDQDGQPCLVMEYLPSRSLAAVLREHGTLPVSEAARIGAEIAGALAAAHQAGIVHRDVKPGNILLDDHGTAKITDFGISHALGDVTLTSTGLVTGTPAFLAPEVARGARSTPAADVFSLGATLYAAVEGEPPFGSGDNPMATLHRIVSGQLNPPRRSGPLTPLLLRMLSGDPGQRPSMAEAGRELGRLRRLEAGDATTRIDPSRIGAAAVPAAGTRAMPPVAGPAQPAARERRRRAPLLLALLAALLLGAVVAGVALAMTGKGSGSPPAAGSHRTAATTHPAATRHRRHHARHRTHPTHRAAPPPPASSSATPSPTPTSTTPSPSTSSSASSPSSGAPTAAQLASAIENYYALLPGNTAAGWSRLTPAYQNTAGGRANYDAFWNGISSVSTSNVVADPPGSVTATITYTRSDGGTSTERRSFGLIRQGGELKINTSEVVG